MKFGLLYEIALPRQVAAMGRTESDAYWEAIERIKFAEEFGGFDIDPDLSKAMWDESVWIIPRMWTEHEVYTRDDEALDEACRKLILLQEECVPEEELPRRRIRSRPGRRPLVRTGAPPPVQRGRLGRVRALVSRKGWPARRDAPPDPDENAPT